MDAWQYLNWSDFPNENQSIWLTEIKGGRERGVSMLTEWTGVSSNHCNIFVFKVAHICFQTLCFYATVILVSLFKIDLEPILL